MAINFNSNREPKDYIFFTLSFLRFYGNILVFNIQVAELGSNLCLGETPLSRLPKRAVQSAG